MKKIIVFENDEEFEMFAVNPTIYVRQTDDGVRYTDWNFTDEYKKEVQNGTHFHIKDENSKIVRRKACNYGIITKYVENVWPYSLFTEFLTNDLVIYNKTYNIKNENN